MKRWPPKTVRITIPSVLGFEKLVVKAVSEIAGGAGIGPDRVEDLSTAVGEVCINAIEHGNRGLNEAAVVVTVSCLADGLSIEVRDFGRREFRADAGMEKPSLDDRIEGKAGARGWGLYLIRQLVDELEFLRKPGGNITRIFVSHNREGV